jgi:hypothetical protein
MSRCATARRRKGPRHSRTATEDGNSGPYRKVFWWNEEWNRFGLASQLTADRRVRVTAICVLVFEAAAEIAAPGRKRGTPTCTGPDTAHPECGWKRGARRIPESTTAVRTQGHGRLNQEPYAWNGLFQNPSEKEKHCKEGLSRASRWSATRVAKKLGKNLSSPLTEAGLLMEDAEKFNFLRLSV